jgi:hypothetical protein
MHDNSSIKQELLYAPFNIEKIACKIYFLYLYNGYSVMSTELLNLFFMSYYVDLFLFRLMSSIKDTFLQRHCIKYV